MASTGAPQAHADRRSFIGGSDARIVLVDDCREKRSEAGPEDLSGKPNASQTIERAGARPSASPVRAAHTEFVAGLAGHPPRPIPLKADALDLEDRADHLNAVLSALSVYVAVVLDDTAQNVPGRLDLRDVEGILASDVTGAIQHAADDMAGEARMSMRFNPAERRSFVGGSDARIIMGEDEAALARLWREKRGEAEPEDLSGNLIVQLGLVTEGLNRNWYERNTGQVIERVQHRLRHPVLRWMGATLDGMVAGSGAVFEAKFMLPWSFSEEAAAEKHMPQLQHNMWVTNARAAALSIITGGGKWVEITITADSLYQHLLLTAEKKFWRCVESGEPPRLFGVEPPRPRIEAVRSVDMASSNAWAEFAGVFCRTRSAFLEHESAKAELKSLMPEDAKEATGHGIRAKRSKSGAVSFDVLTQEEADHAPVE